MVDKIEWMERHCEDPNELEWEDKQDREIEEEEVQDEV